MFCQVYCSTIKDIQLSVYLSIGLKMVKVSRSIFVTLLQILLVGVSLLEQVSTSIVLPFTILLSNRSNVLISPFLLGEGLMQLYLGAEGQTREELRNVIPFIYGVTATDVEQYLNRTPSEERHSALKYGNSLFVAKDVNILPAYEQKITETFNTEVRKVEFANSKAVSEINEWVAKQTDNEIRDIVEETRDDTKMMLVSALHFKGKWQYPFNASETEYRPFQIPNEEGIETVMVETMSRTGIYSHAFIEDFDCEAISLPYADSDLSMVIIKPLEVYGFRKLFAGLYHINVDAIFKDNNSDIITLKLPKFEFEYKAELKKTLEFMGIQELFKSANLKSMTDFKSPLSVTEVVQKTFISVDEEGTTAAAAQEITAVYWSSPRVFDVNQPFVFFIKDNKRIYFAGVIFNPNEK